MTNNDILRRLRYTLNITNQQMMDLYALGGLPVDENKVITWLKRDDDEGYKSCPDKAFAHFLNGLIIHKRGPQEGGVPEAEDELTNNIVLRKLKIAFNLQAEDILAILEEVDFRLSKSELSAFFRKPTHKNFRECKDQVLRNFLTGLQHRLRGKAPESDPS
ncbi:MAG: DUF1456 family protein [Reinekea sp.]|nr:DUF1456 family protein [Reinekea sp.]